ncbi:4Fe-4S ferredoxin N-terminal domain-containing protein [Halopiger goleimassiliensis]|uniref:4Fe-4S ferredoxin N-terminal domain-containing protein n=1 Tax=Halopiger goleimassiliensis TaxID=1293048 RepID=UPI00067767D9|nr:4Fe-4S ferredoxin N-terminal domain-containing protein [Halopiger goleimassiliensis]
MSADDESFHPLGSEWEGELESMLDETEYDTDLGLEMAKDAMRVTKGELSEAEFHEKYHEDVMAEFGEDQRPTQEAFEEAQAVEEGTFSRMLEKFDGDGEEGRRDVMKKMGAGAAFLGLGAWGAADGSDPEPNVAAAEDDHGDDDGLQWGMTIDLEQCDGCLSCMQACGMENNLDQGVNWMYVLDYEDGGPDTSQNRLVRPCQHCTDAPCEKVCPTTARHTRDSDGLVLTDYDVCIGCRYCQVACPYGVNYFQWDEPDISTDEIAAQAEREGMNGDHMTDERGRWVDSRAPRGVMSKCTMCPTRQDGHMGDEKRGTTACEDACDPGAIQFGDVNDERSDAGMYKKNPSRGRALWGLHGDVPDPDALAEELSDSDDDLESIVEASEELDEDLIARAIAIEMTGEEMGEGPEHGTSNLAETERDILEFLEFLSDQGLDLEDEELLDELGISDPQDYLEAQEGNPESNFNLLDDIGTNPNVQYLGNEPGPHAEQVEGPVAYEDVIYPRADEETVNLVDKRQEVLNEGTVGDAGVSL